MADLTEVIQMDFVKKIYQEYKADNEDWRRPHLGASILGTECARALWYSFRWGMAPDFDGRILRLFDTGKREELRVITDMRRAGLEVFDTQDGKQIGVSFSVHLSGSVDAVARGFAEAPKAWHVVEIKTHNDKSFADLKKNGVQKSKPLHYTQMQVYMMGLHLDRAVYVSVCKSSDEIHAERIKLDKDHAQSAIDRGHDIIASARAPAKISDNPAAFACKFCNYWAMCQGRQSCHAKNCRTCLHSSPVEFGWDCAKHDCFITGEKQREGCPNYLAHPDFSPWLSVVDAGSDWLKYIDESTGQEYTLKEGL